MKRSTLFVCLALILLLVMAGIPVVSAVSPPTISRVSPSSGTNDGYYTLTISGSNLGNVTTVRLNKCKLKTGDTSEPPFSGEITGRGAGQVTARFNLNGKKVGDYDVSVNAPGDLGDNWGVGDAMFHIYASGSGPSATKTTKPGSTASETYTTPSEGENSVFFETSPSGATIFLDGTEIGTSTFTYYTDYDGSHRVIAKKLGYEDYEELITIVEGRRTYFRGELIPLSSSSGTTTPSATVSGKPGKTVTTIKKSTLIMPTPLGTFEAPVEESPAGPATVLWAVVLGIALLVIRRR